MRIAGSTHPLTLISTAPCKPHADAPSNAAGAWLHRVRRVGYPTLAQQNTGVGNPLWQDLHDQDRMREPAWITRLRGQTALLGKGAIRGTVHLCEPKPITVRAKLVKKLSGVTCWEVWR